MQRGFSAYFACVLAASLSAGALDVHAAGNDAR